MDLSDIDEFARRFRALGLFFDNLHYVYRVPSGRRAFGTFTQGVALG